MGFCRERIGKAHVESRRESFYFGVAYEEGTDPCPSVYGEVEYNDLDDLIAALVDLRDNDERYATWVKAGRRDPDEATAEGIWVKLRPAQRMDLAESTHRRGVPSLLRVETRKPSTFARYGWKELQAGERACIANAVANGWRKGA